MLQAILRQLPSHNTFLFLVAGFAAALLMSIGCSSSSEQTGSPTGTPLQSGVETDSASSTSLKTVVPTEEPTRQPHARLFVTNFETSTDNETGCEPVIEGQTRLLIDLGLQVNTFEGFGYFGSRHITLTTSEGYSYGASCVSHKPIDLTDNLFDFKSLLSPGLAAKAVALGPMGNDNGVYAVDVDRSKVENAANCNYLSAKSCPGVIPLATLEFVVATESSGYRISIDPFPEIDIDADLAALSDLEFPTSLPSSAFDDLPHTLVYENQPGTETTLRTEITLHDLAIDTATGDHYPGGASAGNRYYSMGVSIRNLDPAHALRSGFRATEIVGDDGVIYNPPSFILGRSRNNYLSCCSDQIGPGLTLEGVIFFALPADVATAKLVLGPRSFEEWQIVNLDLAALR